MIGNVELASNGKDFYYSVINCVFDCKENRIFEADFKITGLKLFQNILVCFGRHRIVRFQIENSKICDVEQYKSQLLIADVTIKNGKLFYGTICGRIFKGNSFYEKLNTESIQTLKFTSVFDVVTGNYNFVFLQSSDFRLHKGRVFDLEINNYGFISAGEDRKVIIVDSSGIWCIQETRNYVIKCCIHKNYVVTINKNGWVKLYKDRKLIEARDYGILCVNSVAFIRDKILIGLANGQIERFDVQYECYSDVSKSFIIENLKVTPVEQISKDIFVTSAKDTECHVTKFTPPKIKYEIRGNSVFIYKKDKLDREICVNKPVTTKFNLIGTKNGWLIDKNKAYKVTDDQILDIVKSESCLQVFTKDKVYYLKRKRNPSVSDRVCGHYIKNGTKSLIYESKSFSLCFRYLKNNIGFREITCAIKKDGLLFCGTNENSVIVVKENKLIDTLFILGSPSSIAFSGKKIFVCTLEGYLYELKFCNKLYIKSEIKNSYKITSLFYNRKLYFTDSGGHIRQLKKDGTIKLIKQCDTFISKFVVRDHAFYCCTSDGSLLIHHKIRFKTFCYSIDSAPLHAIFILNNDILLGGDSHKIYKLDIRNPQVSSLNTKSKLAHSSFIKHLLLNKNIFSVSDDGFLKEWTGDLDFVRKYELLIDFPSCFLIENNSCYVFGCGIQKINLV